MRNKAITILTLTVLLGFGVQGQEKVTGLGYRPVVKDKAAQPAKSRSAKKTSAISLPFFEDFADNSFYPDTSKWRDSKIYINNTMADEPPTVGVATFDGIDETGVPYEPTFNSVLRYTDSLTSQPIDLSGYSAADSVYFSFFYQPEGNGFAPQPNDSLMLYFRRANTTNPWTRVWRVPGTTLQPFKQVMIAITNPSFFNDEFQFRFVNKTSINTTDDHWHIDYIRLDANRNINDTAINEIAYIDEPSFILDDYTYMPYHQFLANATAERATDHETSIRNTNSTAVNVTYGYNAVETFSGTGLNSASNSTSIGANSKQTVSFPVYTNTVPAVSNNEPVTFENKYYLQSSTSTGAVQNDTIVRKQHFHNYLAYDDGTAEKSYYLNLFPTLPGKVVIEFNLNEPDTLKGLAIYFGRQVPLAYQKFFSAVVYSDIAFNGGGDNILYQEDFLIPGYLSQISFWNYKFEKPIPLPAGKFYIGTIQPALSSSDSLYFGLDVNRKSDNHAYFSVTNKWEKSSIDGAIMMRPMFGDFFPSVINNVAQDKRLSFDITPNPATDFISFRFNSNEKARFDIIDVKGQTIKQGHANSGEKIYIKELSSGTYYIQFAVDGQISNTKKFIKL